MKFSDMDTRTVTVSRRVLHPHVVAHEVLVSPLLGERFGAVDCIELDEMRLRLSAYVWTEDIQTDTATMTVDIPHVEAPRDWWQHAKQRWAPAWAMRRWPVIMRVLCRGRTVTETHVFRTIARLPEFKYDPPGGCGSSYVIETLVTRE